MPCPWPKRKRQNLFSLRYLRSLWALSGKKVVTLYLHPTKTGIDFRKNGPLAGKELVNWIRDSIASETLQRNMPPKLDMHVCLVIDEAGSSYTKEWFEDRGMLTCLCEEASQLATSVMVVVVGTGLTGRELNSSTDAYLFRMQPWQASDLSQVLKMRMSWLRLAQHESIDTVAHAIFAHPMLSALATNARSAYFLAKAVARLSWRHSRLSWDVQLNEWTQTLVKQVVDNYIASNSIRDLEINERRRVAASVFRALQKMKEGDTSLPTFEELEEGQISIALSLLQYNLERGVNSVQIIPGEIFAFTLTPALVVVLYAMAGIYMPLVPGWKSDEELVALYAVRQSMLQSIERFVDDLTVSQGVRRMDYQIELDKFLERICLVRLPKQLESNCENVSVPIVDGATIMMNRDNASFADVIAPYTLIQAKHCENPSKLYPVDLYEEVNKCGLVEEEDSDARLLRGLIALWQGKLNMASVRNKATKRIVTNERGQTKSPTFQGTSRKCFILCAIEGPVSMNAKRSAHQISIHHVTAACICGC